MSTVLDTLAKNRGMRNSFWDKLNSTRQSFEHQAGSEGLNYGIEAQKRVRDRKRRAKKEAEETRDMMVNETARTGSVLRAVNLDKILKPRWTEIDNSYQVMSRIKTERQNRRINEMMRYEVI